MSLFAPLATDTKPRRRLVAAMECRSNSSLARVEYHHLDLLKICTWPWSIEFYYVTLASMSASWQGRFCIRPRQGCQR
jgi:hypothetical protein